MGSLRIRAWLGVLYLFVGGFCGSLFADEDISPNPSSVAFGTGFFVSQEGHLITANHVIRDKKDVLVRLSGERLFRKAKLVKDDASRDLALLKVEGIKTVPLMIAHWGDVPIGLESFVLGFPQPSTLGLSAKFTGGLVNGVVKRKSIGERFQFSAEVHRGNSGGPVLSPDGLVIGVIQGKLDALKVAERTKDLPQNVNYAIKSDDLLAFLAATQVRQDSKRIDLRVLPRPYEIAKQAEPSIVLVVGRLGSESGVGK